MHARAAALDERTRIAREIHDVLAHSLGALGVQLELAEVLLAEKSDVDAALAGGRRAGRGAQRRRRAAPRRPPAGENPGGAHRRASAGSPDRGGLRVARRGSDGA
ncbi:histidine kinase [Amycolatopsis sp. H20-H5]|uniref:histidine kinase n=1 Tax=Amycolatopsis sp. H20-H5 TaxID=3046309 RepID=UPI002DBFE661|nr:histidine kinase [Amycolatopsis sp. H20-H5]MEC3975454.1 histidine kinase [Amycolatopsis sp. H20-H5]